MAAQNKLREQMAQLFLAALNEGKIPWQACWSGNRPINAITGKRYRGVNALNLSYWADELGYKDPRWCTYKQAQDKGWQVRKGARAARVEYWACWDSHQKRLLSWSEVEKLLKADPDYGKNLLLKSRVYSVFNAEQIDGVPALEERPQTDIGAIRAKRDVLIRNMGIGYQEGGIRAYYSPGTDTVTLPPEGSFDDTYGYMATFLHECGHATGHPSRMDRDLSGGFGSESYAKEELRAEIASAFTAQSLGLALTDQQLRYHMDLHKAYIQSWAAELKDAPEELFRVIKCAEGISDYLIEKGEFTLEQTGSLDNSRQEKENAKMTVYELNRDQLDELKSAYFWGAETQELLPDGIQFPEEIPDEVVIDYYKDFTFVEEDFSSPNALPQQEGKITRAEFAIQHGMRVRRLTDQERAATPEEYKQDANYEVLYNGQLWYSKDVTLQDLQDLVRSAASVGVHIGCHSPRDVMELADRYPWATLEQLSEIAGGIQDGLTPEQIAVYAKEEFDAGQMRQIRAAAVRASEQLGIGEQGNRKADFSATCL